MPCVDLRAAPIQIMINFGWGEAMAVTIAATGDISSSIYYLFAVALVTIMFTNLFIGMICDAFFQYSGVSDMFREIEQRIVAQGIIRKIFLKLRYIARIKAASRRFREQSSQSSFAAAGRLSVPRLSRPPLQSSSPSSSPRVQIEVPTRVQFK